ncbi:hypothetical protein Tco_0935303 [Tanacetum coccineum]
MSSVTAQQTKLDLELGRDIDPLPSEEDTVSFLRELVHTGEINSLNDVVVDQMHQPWRNFVALINREMKESKAYKTYLGYATGVVPPKMARKFKKAFPSKKDSDLVLVDEEPVQKVKRVKRPAKKSTTTPTAGFIIRETPVETKTKRKEKVDVTRGKEVRKNSLRDFHMTHPSGSGTVSKKPPRVEKITPTITSEGTGDKPGVPDVTKDDLTESRSDEQENEGDENETQSDSVKGSDSENESEEHESNSEQQEEVKDDDKEEDEFVHTPSHTDDKDDDNLESKSDDVNEEQVIDDAHVTISTITKKTEVPVTSSSRSSDLASKFINFLDIPHADAEIVSPLDVHVHHEVPSNQTPTLLSVPVSVILESSPVFTAIPKSLPSLTPSPLLTTPTPPPTIATTNPLSIILDFASVFQFNDRITALEKEVVELKKNPLHTQVTTLVDEHLDTRLGETREEFMNFLSESLMARIKEQVKDQLPQILPKEVSNFAPPVIEALIKESRDEVTLEKVSSQPHSTYEAASTLTEFELKKILIDKMEKSESYLAAPEHQDCYDSLKKSYNLDKDIFFSYDVYTMKRSRKDKDKDEDPFAGSNRGSNSQPKSAGKSVQSEELEFEVADSDIPQDQEGNLVNDDVEPRKEAAPRHN